MYFISCGFMLKNINLVHICLNECNQQLYNNPLHILTLKKIKAKIYISLLSIINFHVGIHLYIYVYIYLLGIILAQYHDVSMHMYINKNITR